MKNKLLLSIVLFTSISIHAEVLLFSKAYALALENAHSLKASVFQVEAAKERIVQEESRLYPQINLSGYYKKSEYTYPDANRDTLEQGLINYGLSLKQSVYNAEIYSRIDIETSKNELYQLGIELEKEELAQTVFIAYLESLKSLNKINLYESHLKYASSRLEELEKKYEKQMINKMDMLEMRVEYQSAQIDLTKERKFLNVQELKLKQLIGDIQYELPRMDTENLAVESMEQLRLSVLNKDNFALNLQLLQSKLEVKIAQLQVKNAKDGHYPTLDFEGSVYSYDTDDPDIQAPYKNTMSLMLILNIPIYSGGLVSSRIRENKLFRKSMDEKLLNTHKEIQVRYDENLARFEASLESVTMYKDAYSSSLLYVDAIEQGYEHGLKSIVDVNDAKNRQYDVKYRYIENMYEMVDSYIGLLIVTNNFDGIELLDELVK